MALSPRTRIITIALVSCLWSAGPAFSDTLLIEGVDAARQTAGERPARGSTMASVEARFGSPNSRSGAVGRPPITRWDYSDFVVFFEYDHVVHSVRR